MSSTITGVAYTIIDNNEERQGRKCMNLIESVHSGGTFILGGYYYLLGGKSGPA